MTTIVQHYNKTGVIDLNLPWSLSEYAYMGLLENFTDKQRDIYNRLVQDNLEVETALVLASRFEAFGEDDHGYVNVKDAVIELFVWGKQPEGLTFWIAYDAEHRKKYNP